MSTTRDKLQKLLVANEDIMDGQESDDLYMEWAELALTVSQTMDGFVEVLTLTKSMRDAQKAFFAARKSGHIIEANKQLEESKRLERQLDKLLAHWTHEMAPTPTGNQTTLF